MEHPRIIAASAMALAATLFAIFSMRPWARRVGLVDKPDMRKQHSGRVPLIGGICFFIGLLVGLAYLGFIDRFVMSLMMGAALIVAVGVADDVVHLSVGSRLMIEAAIVGLVILSTGYYVDHLGGLLPADHYRLGILGIPLTIFAVIGLINAFNMLDGIDGLAASVAMVCIAAVLTYDHAGWAAVGVMLMLQVLFAALIPYIFVNLGWPDGRKVFMGDAGSTAIGFLVGWSLIYLSHSRVGRLAPVDVLWCVAVPVMDTLAVMYRRVRAGRSPFGADRQHLHHLLIDAGFSNRGTLAIIVASGGLLAMLGYSLRGAPDALNLLIFLAATVLYVLGLPRLLELRTSGFAWRPARPALPLALLRRSRAGGMDAAHASDEDHEPYPFGRQGEGPLRALCVVAATPDAITVAPIARRLADDDRFHASVCLAEVPGTDGDAALELFGLRADGRLSGAHDADALVGGVRELFAQIKPDVVLLPGNTPATFALSLTAHAGDVPVVCVDADTPASPPSSHWPNDASRRIMQSLAGLHVAASENTGRRLHHEGVPRERLLLQRDIAGHALRAGLESLRGHPGFGRLLAQRLPFLRPASPLLLVLGTPACDTALVEALEMIARRRPDVDIVWPGCIRAGGENDLHALRAFANVHALDGSDYLTWIHLLDRARLVLAGQGAPCEGRMLGKPVLLVREESAGGDANGVVIGTTALAIAGRVLTLLADAGVYQATCAAAKPAAGPDDGCQAVLEALLRMRGGGQPEPVDTFEDRYAYGVREAS